MARISGIDIYKQLPRTNCGDCGVPTCMAFAMQVASQKAAVDGCPHVSDEARTALGAAQTPPMATVILGAGDGFAIGGETVLHRHEGKFCHPPMLAVRLSDTLTEAEIDRRVDAVHALQFDRVGRMLGVDGIAIAGESPKMERFCDVVTRVASITKLPLILLCSDPDVVAAAASMAAVAAEHGLPMIIRAPSAEMLADLSHRATEAGVKNLVLDPAIRSPAEGVSCLTELRRLATCRDPWR